MSRFNILSRLHACCSATADSCYNPRIDGEDCFGRAFETYITGGGAVGCLATACTIFWIDLSADPCWLAAITGGLAGLGGFVVGLCVTAAGVGIVYKTSRWCSNYTVRYLDPEEQQRLIDVVDDAGRDWHMGYVFPDQGLPVAGAAMMARLVEQDKKKQADFYEKVKLSLESFTSPILKDLLALESPMTNTETGETKSEKDLTDKVDEEKWVKNFTLSSLIDCLKILRADDGHDDEKKIALDNFIQGLKDSVSKELFDDPVITDAGTILSGATYAGLPVPKTDPTNRKLISTTCKFPFMSDIITAVTVPIHEVGESEESEERLDSRPNPNG